MHRFRIWLYHGWADQFGVTKTIVISSYLTLKRTLPISEKGGKHIEALGFSISVGQRLLPDCEDLVSKPYSRNVDEKLWRQYIYLWRTPILTYHLKHLWGQQQFAGILKIPGHPTGSYIQFPWQILCSNYDLLK